jgi:hypothetical protein
LKKVIAEFEADRDATEAGQVLGRALSRAMDGGKKGKPTGSDRIEIDDVRKSDQPLDSC